MKVTTPAPPPAEDEPTVAWAPAPLLVNMSQVYVPGIEATVAHLLFLVKKRSFAITTPSTADKSGANIGFAAVPVELGLTKVPGFIVKVSTPPPTSSQAAPV